MQEECKTNAEDGLATAMHATQAAAHSQLDYCSPSSIAFGCDMVLNIPFHTDLVMLRDKRQQKIDACLVCANARRMHYDFQPGMKVYVLTKSKLNPVYQGLYEIVHVHTNGTVMIQLSENMTDRVNICHLKQAS